MTRKRIAIIGGSVVLLAGAAAGGSTAAFVGSGDSDPPLTGDTLTKATDAALALFPEGATVIETEAGDGGAAYSVEVRSTDGQVYEVNLDSGFNVMGQEADYDGPNDVDGPNDN